MRLGPVNAGGVSEIYFETLNDETRMNPEERIIWPDRRTNAKPVSGSPVLPRLHLESHRNWPDTSAKRRREHQKKVILALLKLCVEDAASRRKNWDRLN